MGKIAKWQQSFAAQGFRGILFCEKIKRKKPAKALKNKAFCYFGK